MVTAFETTLGSLRTRFPLESTNRWESLPDTTIALLCYIDGAVPKSAPGRSASFDRVIAAVVNGDVELLQAGYASDLPAP